MKRGFDILVSIIGLVMLSPLLLLLCIAIRIFDGKPVFYRQERIGRLGRSFQIWKFRSMSLHADKNGPSITKAGDPRVTKLGRILREWKLDELPQLLNVLFGEMSIVGPRPEVPRYVALYTEKERRVLLLTPGLTDLATLNFRDEEALLANAEDPEQFYRQYCIPKKIALNLEYAARASLVSDVRLILSTLMSIGRFSR